MGPETNGPGCAGNQGSNLRLYKSHIDVEAYVNLDFQQILTIFRVFKQSKANKMIRIICSISMSHGP